MTFREKLADWLTGGKYSEMQTSAALSAFRFAKSKAMNNAIIDKAESTGVKYINALESIASIPVTPSSNGQTRKAVRIAKEALRK